MTEATLRFRGQRTHFKKCQRGKWPVLVFNWHLTHQLGKTHIGLYSWLHISPKKRTVYTNRQREVLTQPLTLVRLICPTALTQPVSIHEHTRRDTDPTPRLEPIKQKKARNATLNFLRHVLPLWVKYHYDNVCWRLWFVLKAAFVPQISIRLEGQPSLGRPHDITPSMW